MSVSVHGEEGRENMKVQVLFGEEKATTQREVEGLKEGWTKNKNVSTSAFGQGGSCFSWLNIMAEY